MSNVSAKFTVNPQKAIDAQFLVNITNKDHSLLTNRDLPDQHPISAITGLQEALAEIPTDYVTDSQLETALSTKQDTISDLETIRTNASNGASAYTTIQGYGDIVTHDASEFATSAQGALADTALQSGDNISELVNNSGYITSSALSGYATEAWVGNQGYITGITSGDVTTALGYTPYDASNPSGYTSNVGTVTSVNNTSPDGSGNVTLSIPAAQVNSDWNANSGVAEILNKPTIPTVPTNVSAFTNDAGYITSAALTGYATENYVDTGLSGKQATLVSGTNIKTVNNQSVLGSGNITIGGAVDSVNGKTGAVVLTASDVGALPDSTVIPTVNNSTITLTQGGVTKGSFTLNQASGAMIDFDAGGGSSYTAGTGIDITSNMISVTTPTLTNEATGTNALTVLGNNNGYNGAINIGSGSSTYSWSVAIGLNAKALGSQSTSLGYASSVGANGTNSVAIGANAKTGYANFGIEYAIQLGCGTNEESNSFYVGTSSSNNWKLLGSDGLIPAGRIPISTSVDSTSTNSTVVGAKLFYDTCGDIETLINAL